MGWVRRQWEPGRVLEDLFLPDRREQGGGGREGGSRRRWQCSEKRRETELEEKAPQCG